MAINDFEIASLFGCLDSETASDTGVRRYAAYSSHFLRQVAMNHNRQMCKSRLLFNLSWPINSTTSGADVGAVLPFSGNSSLVWDLIHPAIPIFKLPGSSLMNIRMTLRVGASSDSTHTSKMYFQFCTLASGGLDPSRDDTNSPFVQTISGAVDDGFTTLDLDDVPMQTGDYEELLIFVRGDTTTELAPTATYGSPNSGQVQPDANNGDQINSLFIVDASATWNKSGGATTNNFADAGFLLQFEDSGGTIIFPPKLITSVDAGVQTNLNGTRIWFDPPLTPWEREEVRGYGGYYSIVAGPIWAIGNVMGYSAARTR